MFVHLHCHSHYSFLRAVPTPEEIIAAAAEQVQEAGASLPASLHGGAVALTDTNGLYAAVPFYLAAREAGVKPVIGTELDVELRVSSTETRGPVPEAPGAKDYTDGETLLLLATDRAGYSNLCRLVTERQLQNRPVSLEALETHRAGLIALYALGKAGRGETRNTKLETRGTAQAGGGAASLDSARDKCCAPASGAERAAQLRDIFGDALYLEVHHFSAGDARGLREAARLSAELGVPLAATNNVHFIRPEEHLHHRVLGAIRTGALLTTVAPPDIVSAEAAPRW